MVVSSTMLPLGTAAPAFSLPDTVGGDTVSPDGFTEKALLVIFMCNHCPFVKHVAGGLVQLSRDYAGRDVAIVGISANDTETHPGDSPEELGRVARKMGYGFPVLFDETQEVAKAYTAACTPDFFLFGPDRTLVYRGQFDDSRPNTDTPVTGADVRAAIDAVLRDGPVPETQRPSVGCNVKWKPGNEPDYA